MYEVFTMTKRYFDEEPKTEVSFELPQKEWNELVKTEGWKTVESFLQRKKEGIPNKFEVLKGVTDIKKFSELIYDILKDKRDPKEIEQFLSEGFSEEGLQTLESIAQSDYPLSFERKQ